MHSKSGTNSTDKDNKKEDFETYAYFKRNNPKTYEIKDMIEELEGKIDNLKINIFRATQNVNMEAILGWQKGDKKFTYLDFYDE
jgi:hypothetical protein